MCARCACCVPCVVAIGVRERSMCAHLVQVLVCVNCCRVRVQVSLLHVRVEISAAITRYPLHCLADRWWQCAEIGAVPDRGSCGEIVCGISQIFVKTLTGKTYHCCHRCYRFWVQLLIFDFLPFAVTLFIGLLIQRSPVSVVPSARASDPD